MRCPAMRRYAACDVIRVMRRTDYRASSLVFFIWVILNYRQQQQNDSLFSPRVNQCLTTTLPRSRRLDSTRSERTHGKTAECMSQL